MTAHAAQGAQLEKFGGRTFSYRRNQVRPGSDDVPLVVAIHGGGYNSSYFDIDGFSLLSRAQALNIPVVALDRAGYGATEILNDADLSHQGQADLLTIAIGDLWSREDYQCNGVILVGHSIGGAIALDIAGRQPTWPLLGVAVSGIGLTNAPGDEDAWKGLPLIPFIEFPTSVKDEKMFGPPATFVPSAPERSHSADAPLLVKN